jgi:hypothetical protein
MDAIKMKRSGSGPVHGAGMHGTPGYRRPRNDARIISITHF